MFGFTDALRELDERQERPTGYSLLLTLPLRLVGRVALVVLYYYPFNYSFHSA